MELNGLLRHYVIFMMLLVVKGKPTPPAVNHDCNSTLRGVQANADTVALEANQLLEEYVKLFTSLSGSIPDEVPNATIFGTNTSERLQNIDTKLVLFQWHLSKIEEYLGEHGSSPEPLSSLLKQVKSRLSYYFRHIEALLKVLDPEFPLPTKATPPELSHNDSYAKKYYGWAVISSLKDLSENVKQELQHLEEKRVCDIQTAGSNK